MKQLPEADRQAMAQEAIRVLNLMAYDIFILRFGLGPDRPMNIRVIAKRLDVSVHTVKIVLDGALTTYWEAGLAISLDEANRRRERVQLPPLVVADYLAEGLTINQEEANRRRALLGYEPLTSTREDDNAVGE